MVAEKIYKSTYIYTVTNGKISGGVAVTNGKILAIGSMDKLQTYIAPETEVIDLGDKLLMPAFIEGHTHMNAYVPKVDMSNAESIEECVALTTEFRKQYPDAELIIGEKWYAANWGGTLPTKEDIDSALPDVPFYASDMDSHMIWMNSAFMKKYGLSKETIETFSKGNPDMVNVDADGNPTGVVHDEVTMDILLNMKIPDTVDNILAMFDVWTRYGVTAVNDMDFYSADSDMFRIVKELEEEGRLNVRVFASFNAAKATPESIEAGKKMMHSDMFRLNSLKTFLDGTGSGYTAYMLKPYKGTDIVGRPYETKETLVRYLKLAYEHGIALHTHCCGDAAVRHALDSYTQAAKEGVRFDHRFSIEHCDTTDPEDVKRPAELGISLNLTPDFLAPTKRWKDNPYLQVYDEEEKAKLWTMKSFLDTGANVSFGTDYTASSMNPMDQLYRAVERKANDGLPENGYRPEEKLTLDQAVFCYTMGSARSVGMGDKLGSLESGKYADMIVLDTNIFESSMEDVKKAVVEMTILNGKIVYQK